MNIMEETEVQIKSIKSNYINVSYLQNSYEDYKGIRCFASLLDDIMIKYNKNIKGCFYYTLSYTTVLHVINTYCNPIVYKGENIKPEYESNYRIKMINI
jgi:hypothetical protein